jgi:hypothetical protein
LGVGGGVQVAAVLQLPESVRPVCDFINFGRLSRKKMPRLHGIAPASDNIGSNPARVL